ncbi:hypothetical protein L9F63_003630 [Diploptera punctata]|uniref:Uncharacterized protein n=1 Tax=Diploptera punctata TaxID=6984 RepID=A0AAD7ZL11_DIPPU|nr:hypothetical protein L9F63_003630 [Diploptera punctata]
MECEMRALRRELEETRTALKLQTVRCRQLVAAFTTKLQEKEMEVRAGRELRDQQLGRVLRALLVLEARLRKEQKHIRQQLCDRDQVISRQQQEINRLKAERVEAENKLHQQQNPVEEKLDTQVSDDQTLSQPVKDIPPQNKKQNEGVSTQQEEPSRRLSISQTPSFKPSQPTAFVRFKKNGRHFGSYRPISRRREISGEEKCFNVCRGFDPNSHDLDDSLENGHEDEFGTRDLSKDYQHNPVLECVNQILLRDHEEIETSAYKRDTKTTGRFHYQCHSIKEQDEEETSEEEEVAEKEKQDKEENQSSEIQSSSDISKINTEVDIVNDQTKETSSEPKRWSVKDKTPSPPIKAQLLEEKACLLMASQRLTIVCNKEFEELDRKDTNEDQKSSAPPKPPVKNGFLSNKNLIPPALPPKPPQLGAKGLYQKKINNSRANQNLNAITNRQNYFLNGNSSIQELKHNAKFCSEPIQEINQNQNENSEIISNEQQKPVNQDNRINQASHLPDKPRHRQILSNGSLKMALSQDTNQQTFANGHDHHQDNNNFCITSSGFEEKLEHMNLSDFQNHSNSLKQRSGGKCTSVKNDNQVESHSSSRHIHNHEPRRTKTNLHNHNSMKGSVEELSSSPKTPPTITNNNNHCGKIRVGSSVSSLITGSSGNSIVNELTKGESESIIVLPKVSQIVRRFEDLGTGMGRDSSEDQGEEDGNEALRRNFEEFKLEDVDMDSVSSGEDGGRPAGDGAEARATVVQNGTSGTGGTSNGGGSYEHFLEATGLSQKSILTPSRMYSNHRNVLKPKDVKHRSRILKAAAVSEKSNNTSNGPIVKYWIEPFL